jgi:hypothetical protein
MQSLFRLLHFMHCNRLRCYPYISTSIQFTMLENIRFTTNDICLCSSSERLGSAFNGRLSFKTLRRTTFGTHLAVAGVHPQVTQAAMRHSRIELTTNFYTDPALLDVAGAVEALPAFGAQLL